MRSRTPASSSVPVESLPMVTAVRILPWFGSSWSQRASRRWNCVANAVRVVPSGFFSPKKS